MLSVAVIGATGYTGQELVRLLLKHPQVKITALSSERLAGKKFTEVFPAFQGLVELSLERLDPDRIAQKADFIFLCLPHQKAMETAESFLKRGLPVVDLSADFRISAAEIYEAWYGPHRSEKLLKEAVYGLPELHRKNIQQARLVANPGCYPTSCILGLAPLVKKNMIELDSIYCDSKSGASGAGRAAETANLFCEVNEGLKAYKVGVHRHTPEIEQEISRLAGEKVTLSFTPHLIPMDRGILSTIYAKLKKSAETQQLHGIFEDFYKNEPFVRIRPAGTFPSTQEVRMTNFCDIGVYSDNRTGRVVVITAIDNLTKGASGQAVQNMNLMMGFPENAGLADSAASR